MNISPAVFSSALYKDLGLFKLPGQLVDSNQFCDVTQQQGGAGTCSTARYPCIEVLEIYWDYLLDVRYKNPAVMYNTCAGTWR